MDERPTVSTDEEAAHEDAKNRLLVWRVASQIRLERGVPEAEVVRVTLHGKDGALLFEGDVR
ncbi:MAG: hypothetical protein ACKOCB_12460 [Planctomycetia bacterium]